jgi:DNA-binding NarL/FixJ family response regulator
MPGGGMAAASAITARLPSTVVLMLTVSRDDDDLFEALRRGASGYLLKDMDPAGLATAIRSAVRGEAALSPSVAARLVEQFRGGPAAAPPLSALGRPPLTSRECDVLELLAEGASTAAIARRLYVAPVTVRRHVSAILEKLGVDSREAAVSLVRREREHE